ncbi:hypothetical protein KI387_029538, partial [Taxus chinensis]
MGEWLELGLGSPTPQSATQQPNDANLMIPVTFNSSSIKKERTVADFNAEKIVYASLLRTPNHQLFFDNYHREEVSSSSQYSYLDRNRLFFSPETEFSAHKHPVKQFEERNGTVIITSGDQFPCQNSGQSAALQNVTERIHYRSCNGDFAERSKGQLISGGRKLVSNGMTAVSTQYKPLQYMQQFPSSNNLYTANANANVAKPSRPKAADVWFMLQVAPTKNGERLSPQIPKTYLRIKDETITILLVKKYLANKLGLESESE